MSSDATLHQSGDDKRRAQQLSLRRTRPPGLAPGYEAVRFLGDGAFGEVWVAIDANTGRQVAIKFYTHRGGLDWSLLSREVEKLRFLFSDRYVVQLLDVGWDADPPYYVMEYLERGSLADHLERSGPLPVDGALALFRDIAVGLLHAHARGVLHCDLKPANVLLDDEFKPRLADFGQARLSHEQAPALGTLFYMAPEQADLNAAPDARWDVYALGALFYCMLTGGPPYRDERAVSELETAGNLELRLLGYRKLLERTAPPQAHRRVPGVDRMLADIIDRCLSARPKQRFPNPQAVLDALRERELRMARRPLLILGALGPALLLVIGAAFAWRGFQAAVTDSREAIVRRALDANRFAVRSVAENVAYSVSARFQVLRELGRDKELLRLLHEAELDDALQDLAGQLRDLNRPPVEREHTAAEILPLQEEFQQRPVQQALTACLERFQRAGNVASVYSWFINDRRGTQLARVQVAAGATEHRDATVGKNFAWRAYFHGGPDDLDATDISHGRRLDAPYLSPAIRSRSTREWLVVVSVPILDDDAFLGVLALTVRVGQFATFEDSPNQFWALVDGRAGGNRGAILQHPLYRDFTLARRTLPERFDARRLPVDLLPNDDVPQVIYERYLDPLGDDEEGGVYAGDWLAALAHVRVEGQDTGLVAVVQERRDAVVAPVRELSVRLARNGALGFGVLAAVIGGLWGFVALVLSPRTRWRWSRRTGGAAPGGVSAHSPSPSDGPPPAVDPSKPSGAESNLFP